MPDNYGRRPWTVVLMSGATFFYFLIFAQFGYLQLLEAIDRNGELIDSAMLAMGLGGIMGCLLVAWKFKTKHYQYWIIAGFAGSGSAAAASITVSTFWMQTVVAAAVGSFLGVLTVSIVPAIRSLTPSGQVGRWVGLGTGAAYFFSNLPIIFDANPVGKCLLGVAAGAIGLMTAVSLKMQPGLQLGTRQTDDIFPRILFTRKGVVLVTTSFLGLIWLDSAAFYLIQETDLMKSFSWGTPEQLWANAVTHLLAAVIGGWILDRGHLTGMLLASFVFLAGGFWLLGGDGLMARLGALVYVSGVSLYSTALVAFGALSGESGPGWTIAQRAAMVFGLAGWLGSAMGIGMARDLGQIPLLLVIVILWILGALIVITKRPRSGREETA